MQDSRKDYDTALNAYKPQKKKKDPNEPKQPLSAYFLFSQVNFWSFVPSNFELYDVSISYKLGLFLN